MFMAPLKVMKLRTKELSDAYGASYGKVRNWNSNLKTYTKVHQGWDLEAATGTPCYAIASGIVTHVGTHSQFGKNVLLQFSRSGLTNQSSPDTLFAFYAHLSVILVHLNQELKVGHMIGLTGHSGNASASAPHLHFEIRKTSDASPGLGLLGRLDPGEVLGYRYLVCS
jgi:murein DD-endopeptidase MepM/ murein hydrolase activator NlpD